MLNLFFDKGLFGYILLSFFILWSFVIIYFISKIFKKIIHKKGGLIKEIGILLINIILLFFVYYVLDWVFNPVVYHGAVN